MGEPPPRVIWSRQSHLITLTHDACSPPQAIRNQPTWLREEERSVDWLPLDADIFTPAVRPSIPQHVVQYQPRDSPAVNKMRDPRRVFRTNRTEPHDLLSSRGPALFHSFRMQRWWNALTLLQLRVSSFERPCSRVS